MKLGFLIETMSSHAVSRLEEYVKRGHTVFAITNEINPDLDVKQYKLKYGLPLFISSKGSAFRYTISPFSILQVKNILRKEKPDVLHAHYVSSFGFLGAMCGFYPLVLTVWGSDVLLNPKQYKVLDMMVKYSLRKADAVVCGSLQMIGEVKKLVDRKIELIYFGINPEEFLVKKPILPFTVICTRGLNEIYDPETIIKAAKIVNDNYPEIFFKIIGGAESSRMVELKELAGDSNIEFLGQLPKIDIPLHLMYSDVYVSASKSDGGLSTSTCEAMASGLPVVVTDFGDNTRWIKNMENGFTYPIGDALSLASKIIMLYHNKDMRELIGKNNRKLIETKLTLTTEINKNIEIYKKITK